MSFFLRLIAGGLLLFLAFTAVAQQDNSAFYLSAGPDSARQKTLSVQWDLMGYFKNNEYFAPTLDGYTLFGYQAPIALHYQVNDHWSALGGIYLQKDFGIEGFSTIDPLFSIRYKHGPWFAAFGTLDGSLDHRLIEPLYDFERRLLNPLENGMQFRYHDDRLFADVWVDWQQAIVPGDDEQEIITGGLSFSYKIVDMERASLSVPVQLILAHQGGQTNTANTDPVFTLANGAAGLDFRVREKGFISSWAVQSYAVMYGGNIPDGLFAYSSGAGLYVNAYAESSVVDVMASYWKGSEYISYLGGDRYVSDSRSVVNPLAVEPDRELFILRFMKDVKLVDGIRLSARAEPFWNLNGGGFDINYGLYILYDGGFRLAENNL
ncbi:hypothetical protein AB9P05_12670 [Roseivirga sp. BDSF3-8]|uniref:hypothetical protein n=1 Tax=Roseivirga sp. BDSF3-8 TaxID=3241598 RepID=UPI003532643F